MPILFPLSIRTYRKRNQKPVPRENSILRHSGSSVWSRLWLLGMGLFLLQSPLRAQHRAIRDDGRQVILHSNHTWTFADSDSVVPKKVPDLKTLAIPTIEKGETIVRHTAFSLVYSEKHEQARWVAYQLTAAETEKSHERTYQFLPDPAISTGSATDADYKGSGYDRGHLAPASDMGWSETSMAESFYYSNMSPQEPSFNRGIWKKGEDLVREWAQLYGSLYVVVGPVLKPGLPAIGPNKVSVPERYYKVLLDYSDKEKKAIGFLIPNQGSAEPLESFAVSIDSVEKVTGIDFFPALPDDEEKALEKAVCLSCWDWPAPKPTNRRGNAGPGNLQACKGKNRDGSPCSNFVPRSKAYCSRHSK